MMKQLEITLLSLVHIFVTETVYEPTINTG